MHKPKAYASILKIFNSADSESSSSSNLINSGDAYALLPYFVNIYI